MGLCMIFGCNNRSDSKVRHFSFSRIPAIRYHCGEQEYQLSLKRRTAWLAAISRHDLDESNMQNYIMCSKHFHSSKPAKAMDETNIDWVPTLHLGHEKCQQTSQSSQLQVERSNRARKRAERQRQAEEEQLVFYEAIHTAGGEIINETVGELLNEIDFEIFQLFEIKATAMELVTKRIMIDEFSISIKDVVKEEVKSAMLAFTSTEGNCKCADEVTSLKKELQKCHEIFYIGLPNLKVLKVMFNHACITLPGERSAQCKLTKFQEFMVVMLKLRINPPFVDLSN